MTATYTKLRSGEWGVRSTVEVRAGEQVTVTKKSGETKVETVERVVWKGNGVWLCAVCERPSRSYGYRRGSGAGSAAPVPGYSSWCTDREGCGCYDCAS